MTERGPLFPPVWFLLAVIVMTCLHVLFPLARVIQSPFRYAGLFVMAAGIGLILWAAGLFRRAGTTIKPFQESSSLVVSGPYRLTRNPIYLGMASTLLGIGILLGSITPFLVIPLFVALIDLRFIRAEEAMLQKTFGAAYNEYKERVRRWI